MSTPEKFPPAKVDLVNHPPHYTSSEAQCSHCGQDIECIDVTRHMGFNLGNAVKYIWREAIKGSAIQDLKKALWYIQDEINKREKKEAAEKKAREAFTRKV